MLRSSYSDLEKKASTGMLIIVAAILFHMTASVVSVLGLYSSSLIRFIWPIFLQALFSLALFRGKGWARWILIAYNSLGCGFLLWIMTTSADPISGFLIGRTIIFVVVALLLLLPPVNNYIQWKKLRF